MTEIVYATADDLTEGPLELDEEDLTLSSGKTIRLRGLSRAELFRNGKGTEDPAVVEARNLQSACVRPLLTIDQASAILRRVSAGDGQAISTLIRGLSGLAEGADKSAVDEVRD
jgi:hypothetical protein